MIVSGLRSILQLVLPIALATAGLGEVRAQSRALQSPSNTPVPPADIPNVPSPPPGPTIITPGSAFPPPAPPPPAASVPPPAAPTLRPGELALAATARFGRDAPPIASGLHWRVYPDRPDQNGAFRLIKEDRSAQPTFALPRGGYVVHVSFGLASAVKAVQLRTDQREVFEIPAGGLALKGQVGDVRIPAGQISFDIYQGSQFDPGERRPVA